MFARPAAVAAAALVAVGLLSGCEKPLPEIAAVTGGTYVDIAASVYCFDGDVLSGSCRERAGAGATMTVRPGDAVAIEVPQTVRERDWYVRVVDAKGKVLPGPIQNDRSYFRLSANFGASTQLKLQVLAVLPADKKAATGQPSGVWDLTLVNADAPRDEPAPVPDAN